jgi:hypothetical protein
MFSVNEGNYLIASESIDCKDTEDLRSEKSLQKGIFIFLE